MRSTAKLKLLLSSDSASLVTVTSVPEEVLSGTARVTVPFALPSLSRVMDVLTRVSKLRSLLTLILKLPSEPLVVTVKGRVNCFPGSIVPTG